MYFKVGTALILGGIAALAAAYESRSVAEAPRSWWERFGKVRNEAEV
jgi:hypothetical protein